MPTESERAAELLLDQQLPIRRPDHALLAATGEDERGTPAEAGEGTVRSGQ
jgi:hypothetical protein